ncbi:hypothetical protein MINTM008_52050 [Mycobacterium intracellulare]|uniref:Uncharacterized protein n=2 Tax=Mycobacterium avium complex (MAC) TaxID=120793 RepID=A0A7R7MZ15_MYCIT|nr:hypothetical protein MPRI_15990 [Mycobacterium paraintracellulare]BCO49265.1 hypothetical protein MINTM002_49390 [Mycobacterium intracellulare]BCP39631.1 hypothetical protein MINTMi198_50010 [Mycobacterium intracellulare M.i.198]BCO54486.1 hypothetical protein MINTM003_49270 [Mycobacterium paraintracellulare]BCO59778.1 hypothetical protein MINTM005_50220 [Mycobacterium intracellulare]
MRQAIGAGLEVIEGDDRAGRVQDDSRFVGADIRADLHAQTVPPPNLTGVKWWVDPASFCVNPGAGRAAPAIMQSSRAPWALEPDLGQQRAAGYATAARRCA